MKTNEDLVLRYLKDKDLSAAEQKCAAPPWQ